MADEINTLSDGEHFTGSGDVTVNCNIGPKSKVISTNGNVYVTGDVFGAIDCPIGGVNVIGTIRKGATITVNNGLGRVNCTAYEGGAKVSGWALGAQSSFGDIRMDDINCRQSDLGVSRGSGASTFKM